MGLLASSPRTAETFGGQTLEAAFLEAVAPAIAAGEAAVCATRPASGLESPWVTQPEDDSENPAAPWRRTISFEEANLALVRRIFHEGSSVPNPPAIVREIFAVDFICHGPPGVNHSHTMGEIGPEHCMLLDAFTDVTFTVEEIGAEGGHIRCRFSARVLQIAEFQGRRPSGHPATLTGITTFRVADNRVKEGWGVLSWG